MALITWIRRRREAKIVEQQVDTLTARCVGRVRDCVASGPSSISTAEARGSIRAYATHVLHQAVEQTDSIPEPLRDRVIASAVERVTSVLVERHVRRIEPRRVRHAA